MWIALALLAGLTGLGSGIHEALVQRRLRRNGVRASGLVVRHNVRSAGKDGGTVSFAVVAFVDAQGVRHEFECRSSGVKGLPVGGRVPVRYLPDVPATARIDRPGRRRWDVAFPLAVGALFLGVAARLIATGR